MSGSWSWRAASAPGVAAVRSHWAPFLAIQLAAAALVVVYAQTPAVREWCTVIERIKVAGGIPFAFIAGAIAGGVIPEIAKALTGRMGSPTRQWFAASSFNALVYAMVGVQVDLFYRFQTWCFGSGTDFQTLVMKTAVDMAIFTPVLSIPLAVLMFEWKRVGFDLRRMGPAFTGRFYLNSIVPALIPCWAFWIPILICVYSLPANLQFVFALLAEAAWSILFVFIATNGGQPAGHQTVASEA